ncbi:MAG: DUF3592 domain-containing protein [Elusimicrobia bacterium]|nr:DUF3592 domain-containing protein [Elusimicrobiota bacterium]
MHSELARMRSREFVTLVVTWIRRIMFGLGLLMITIMSLLGTKLYSLHKNGRLADGTVVRYHESQTETTRMRGSQEYDEAYTLYAPVIEFEAEGKKWTFTSNQSSHGHDYRLGEIVQILYHAQNPAKAEIARNVKTFSRLWTTFFIFMGAGLFFLVLSRFLERFTNRFFIDQIP